MSDNRKLPRKKPQDLPSEEPTPEPNNQPPPDMIMDAGLLALEYEEQLERQFKMAHDTPKAEKVIEEPQISPENIVKKKKASILRLGAKKTSKKKVYVESEDMVRLDRHGRTILHRAALDQNVELIRELCTRAKAMDHPGTFINKKDKFGNTALLSACVASIEDVKGGRSKCIEALLLASANPNITNDRTRWSPLDWCAFHGDIPSIQKLLKADAFVFMPDAKGMYPIDHCGLQDKQLGDSRKGAAKIIIERMKQIIIEFDNDQDKREVVQAKYIDNNRYRYLRMPTFRQAALYWAMYFKLKIDEIIKPLLHCDNIFPEMPMKSLSMRNCYHACCLVGNLEALKALFDAEILAKRYEKVTGIRASQGPDEVPMKPAALTFFSITEFEKQAKLFSKKFISNIKKRQDWMNNFQNQVFKQMTTGQEKHKALPYYEHQDDLGNTPLHLASAHGYTDIVKFLLEKDVNIDIQNREGWRCQEIRQFDEIKIAYNEHIQKKIMVKTLELADIGNISLVENKSAEENSQHPLKMTTYRNNTSTEELRRNVTFRNNKGVGKLLDKTLFFHKEKRVIPDVVLVFNIPVDKQNKHNDLLTNRINFNIMNLKTKLTCYMACGVSKKLFYLMIKMDERKLAKICSENAIKVKLLGDYAHHPFNLRRKAEFEPFRSRQRQEITLTALNKIVDLNQLRHINVLDNIYPMHTIAGLDKIFNIWVWPKKWYLPEPLASLYEYFGEGKILNFGAITALRSYFGEKISFYFAWISFYTCNLLWLAVPGLAVYILQLVRPGYEYVLLPAWVTYNSLVCTLLVEKWKRKSSEIATRWGTIDLENKTMDEKTIRRDYVGDEAIEDITMSLTKVSRHSHRLFYYVISSIILIILGAVVVGSFVLTEKLTSDDPDTETDEANKYPPIIKTLIGCINGVIVAIANFIYEKAARYFASKENHKFNDSHEKSLIFKIVLFKALNSYLGLFYLTFIKRKNFSDMFYNLVSLLITNQASALATSFLLPFVQYKSQLKLYFNKIAAKGKSQWDLKGKNYTSAVPHGDNQQASQTYPYLRSVLDCSTGTTSDKKWDLMQVELNSLKVEKPDILDYYGSTLVQWGYITMFSPAFALGPLLAIAANIIDIKAKIYTFLTVYQRPVAEKAGGIGYWLYAWEITSIVAIFINALSLFFNLDSTMNFMEDFFGVDDTQDIITDPSKDIDRLWVFVIVVHIILIVKFLVIALVPDKPKWVLKREEKQQHEEDQAMEMQKDAEAVLRVQTLDADTQKLMMSKIQEKQAKKTVALFKSPQNSKLNGPNLSNKDKKEPPQESNFKPITSKSPENVNNETKQVSKPPRLGKSSAPKTETPLSVANVNLGQAIKSVLLNTFTNVERTLGVMRISDVTKLANTMMVNCFFCNKERSTLHCLTCNTAFCDNCHTQVHNKVNVSKHRVVPFNSGKPSQASNSKVSSPEKNSADANNWRKFETFNFPISKASNFFFTLKIAYQFLYKLYITDNAITNDNQLSNIQKALKFNAKVASSDNKALLKNPEEKELEGELDFTQDKTADRFLELDQYNTEEKFFLNRVAFLNFKKRGAQSTFDDFLKKIKVLEEGSLESKLFLMFDLIDQNDDGMIARREVEDIFKCSIMQNLVSPNELGETLDGLFQTKDEINKPTIFELVVSNQRAKNLFLTFMQVKAT